MILTTQQVKDKLGVGSTTLANMIAAGTITPINKRKPGAKKFFMKFNSRDINALKVEPTKRVAKVTVTGGGLATTLARIEEKVDRLLGFLS